MSDYELKTTLTADGSPLADAMRQAEKRVGSYVDAVSKSSTSATTAATAAQSAATAVNAQAAATSKAVAAVDAQAAAARKAADEVSGYTSEVSKSGASATSAATAAQGAAAAVDAHSAAAQKAAAGVTGYSEAVAKSGISATDAAKAATAAAEAANIQEKAASKAAAAAAADAAARKQAAAAAAAEAATSERAAAAEAAAKAQAAAQTQKVGVSAAQTANAMRQLPAQITDITTSLASGMPVWMVAIQQGGQIKDAFGGIGPAFTALSAAISPTMAAIGGVGTAAVIAALAYAQGSAEADAYTRAIIMSGNAAGTTTSRLTAMAERIDTVVGTQADAAAVLAQLTATGQVANANLEGFAATSVRMQRVLGQSIDTTVGQFEQLGRKPLEASTKLNESYGYLTASIYDRIKALEKQGRIDEAGEVAQQAFAKAMDDRTRQIEANAGSIERAWRGIKDIAAEAWDAMLGIGRKKTTQQELDLVGQQLQALDSRKSTNPQRTDALRETLRQRQAELQEQLRFESRSAESQAAERAATDKHIRDADQAEKLAEARSKASIDRIKSQLQALTGAYGDADRILEAQRAAGQVSDEQYWQAKRSLIALEEQAQVRALQQENQVLAAQKATGAEKIRLDSEMAQNAAEMARVRAKAAADTVIANAQEAAGISKLQRAYQEYVQQLNEAEAARQRQQDREMATLGRGDAARNLAGRQNAVDDRVLQQRQQLDTDRLAGRLTEAEYQARLGALQAYHQRALQAEVTFQAQRQAAEMDGTLGMQRALENYLDSARNVAGQTEQLFGRAFQGMEDGIVQFAMTGKASFSDFAESVVADLIRIYVRQQLVGLLGSAFGGMFSASGGTSVNGSAGSSFIPANVAHGGGMVGSDSFQQRMVPTSVYANAPRFHTGFAADEYAAVLQKGESVFTAEQVRRLQPAGAAPTVNVAMPAINIINNNAGQNQVATRQRSDGGIDVLIEAAEANMADRVASGQGPLSQAIEGRYGLRPAMA